MSIGEEKLIESPDKLKSCTILHLPDKSKDLQLAMLCHNLVKLGEGSHFPAYFYQIAKSIYDENIRDKYEWKDIIEGKVRY